MLCDVITFLLSKKPKQRACCTKQTRKPTDLKGELCTAEVSLLFLPEVVRFDDERHADFSREKFLQCLQQRLYQLPLGATHVDDDGKTTFTYVLTDGRNRGSEEMTQKALKLQTFMHEAGINLQFLQCSTIKQQR